jgi:hypothetical protein
LAEPLRLLIPRVVVYVGQWAAGRQELIGIANFEGFQLAAHASMFFDGGLQAFLEGIDTVFVIAGHAMT